MGKAERFPLFDENTRAKAIGEESNEIPLLLDPTVDDPTDYIHFVEREANCFIEPIHQDSSQLEVLRARASINIYGLNRRGLIADRTRYMVRVKMALARLERLAYRLQDAAEADVADIESQLADEMFLLRMHTSGRTASLAWL